MTDSLTPDAHMIASYAAGLRQARATALRQLADAADHAARATDAATDDLGECERCECTGRITVHVTDGHGGYDGSAPCPDCRPVVTEDAEDVAEDAEDATPRERARAAADAADRAADTAVNAAEDVHRRDCGSIDATGDYPECSARCEDADQAANDACERSHAAWAHLRSLV